MHGDDAAYYQRVERWNARPGYRAEVALLVSELRSVGEKLRVLDLGCGAGAVMESLAAAGHRPVGIDRSAAWAAACRVRPVARADGAALPFRAGVFDAILLVHVLAHLAEPGEALREAHRVIRPGGCLFVLTPNLRFLRALRPLRPVSRLFGYRPDPTVERHYTLGEVTELVRAAGFAVATARAFGKRPWTWPLGRARERLAVVARRLLAGGVSPG